MSNKTGLARDSPLRGQSLVRYGTVPVKRDKVRLGDAPKGPRGTVPTKRDKGGVGDTPKEELECQKNCGVVDLPKKHLP